MKLESLANELLLDLFELLDGVHLLRAFYGLNNRFNNLLLIHFQAYSFDFRSVSKTDFDFICQQHLPLLANRIHLLHLPDNDETPEQTTSFLSHNLTLYQFTYLQSLLLSNISSKETMSKMISELYDLPHLIHLSIVDCNVDYRSSVQFIDSIWNLPKLIHCNLFHAIFPDDLFDAPTVVSLSLQNLSIFGSTDIRTPLSRVLKYTPCLRRLSISLIDNNDCQKISCCIPSMKILQIYCENSTDGLKSLLQYMPNLSQLTLETFGIHIDGYQLEKIITDYLPKLKILQLRMAIPSHDKIDNEEQILDSFRTRFWIVERHWFVRCHWDPYYSCYYLYTLPYASSSLSNRIGERFKSTCPQSSDYTSYDRIEDLNYSSVPLAWVSHIRFSKIQRLCLDIPFEESFWSVVPTLYRLTSLSVNIPDYDDGQSQLQTLLDKAPRLYSLTLYLDLAMLKSLSKFTSETVRKLDLILEDQCFSEESCVLLSRSPLGIQCEVLSITVENQTNILYLLNNMKNLRALKVQFFKDDTRSFDYIREALGVTQDRRIEWLQQQLPSTCTISKGKYYACIRLWIR